MPSLTVVSGPNTGDYYPLGKRTMVIGRDESVPIQIVDSKASRKHVQIRYEDANHSYIATDMKSVNGTLINGRAVRGEIPLQDGDEICIGDSRIVFSSLEFADKESALTHYKQRGQRGTPTIEQK